MLIGEVCRRAACTPRTVRFYEEAGIITPAGATPGGHKLYGPAAPVLVKLVRTFQDAGCSLKEVKELVDLSASGRTKRRKLTLALRERLAAALAAIRQKQATLRDASRRLRAVLDETQRCETCGSDDCRSCPRLARLRTLGMPVTKQNH